MLFQVLGLIVGISASFIAWLIVSHMIKPKIEISKDIEKGKALVEKSEYIYRIKVKNRNWFYKVFDVSLTGRVMIKGLNHDNPEDIKSFIVKVGNGSTPYINPYKECKDNIKQFVIKVPYSKSKQSGQLKTLYCKYHCIQNIVPFGIEEVLNISSGLDIKFEVTMTCTHNFSGARKIFIQKYTKESIVKVDSMISDFETNGNDTEDEFMD